MSNGAAGSFGNETRGLGGWLLQRLRGGFVQARSERRMRMVETLTLGGKRQLILVICDGERFLVGASGDTVASVTALGSERSS